MPKPTINDARTRATVKRSAFDPEFGSADAQSSQSPDYRNLSFLSGATVGDGTNDMGCDANERYGPFAYAESDWEENYRKTRNLRRHTTEQGMSTFSFPKKK
jgi:hypothetical protein